MTKHTSTATITKSAKRVTAQKATAMKAGLSEGPGRGAANRANIPSPEQFGDLVKAVQHRPHANRALVAIYLSYYCGLRAGEIAGITWKRHIFDSTGKVGKTLRVGGDIGKKGTARTLIIPPKLIAALEALRKERPTDKYVIYPINTAGSKTDNLKNGQVAPSTVAQFFWRLYKELGLNGCSSHSGRAYFITHLARRAGVLGCSIKDVQVLAGHARLETTGVYIRLSDQQAALCEDVSMLDGAGVGQTLAA